MLTVLLCVKSMFYYSNFQRFFVFVLLLASESFHDYSVTSDFLNDNQVLFDVKMKFY